MHFVLIIVAALSLTDVQVPSARLKMFAPLPEVMASADNPLTEAKVDLGRMLYYDPRLSRDQKISCNSCHELARYGVDGQSVSAGHMGQKGNRNSPTVYHAAGHITQFWDGRAPDVEAQAKGPVLNPVEMAMPSEAEVIARLTAIPDYVEAFRKAFPDEANPLTYDNLGRAIGAFERRLVTPSRWDRFLRGDTKALTDAEKNGFNKFVDAGCASCHNGAFLGGRIYQKLGFVKPWPDTSDPGRFKVTRSDADELVFKVPSLRNIEKTAPYFHDGKTMTLEQAVKLMAEYQTGRPLSNSDAGAIVVWLKSLTGPLPAEYIRPPKLPGI